VESDFMPKISSTEDQENQSKKSKLDPTIVIAVVTLIGTVVTAVLASPVLIAWIQKTPDVKTSSSQLTSVPSISPPAENPTPNKSQPSPDVNSTSTSALTSIQTVCITSLDNPQVPIAVDANSLSFSGGSHLPLMSGQSIPFTKMRQFQVTDVITSPPPVIRVTSIKMVITLLDGTTISDVLDGNGHLNGKTKFGGFGNSLDKIKTVEFKEQPAC
jgi:cytoskeletal protein RodZ